MADFTRATVLRINATVTVEQPQKHLRFRIGPVGIRNLPQQGTNRMALVLTDIQHVSLALEADDAAGNPVPFVFPTPPTWTSSDSTILTVTPSADGSSADAATTGKLGNAQVNVSGTSAEGDPLTGLLDITVVTSKATTFKIVAGTPSDK